MKDHEAINMLLEAHIHATYRGAFADLDAQTCQRLRAAMEACAALSLRLKQTVDTSTEQEGG